MVFIHGPSTVAKRARRFTELFGGDSDTEELESIVRQQLAEEIEGELSESESESGNTTSECERETVNSSSSSSSSGESSGFGSDSDNDNYKYVLPKEFHNNIIHNNKSSKR